MTDVILGIHGLNNKPPPSLLLRWWRWSLQDGLLRDGYPINPLPLELIYWSDVLHPQPLDIRVRDPKAEDYLDEPYQPPSRQVPVNQDRISRFDALEAQLDKLFLNEDMPLNYSGISDRIMHRFFGDMETYLQNENARNAIRQRLLDALATHQGDRIMLIAHSMGSIVAYDVLSTLAAGMEVAVLVTIGSPLGLPQVISRIHAAQLDEHQDLSTLRAPECITEAWFNLSDPEDKVALDQTLADDYLPNTRGIRAQDWKVMNDYMLKGNRNPHKSFGYLRTPEVTKLVGQFLEKQTGKQVR